MHVSRLAFAVVAAAAAAVVAGVSTPELVTGPVRLVGPLYFVPDPRWTAAGSAFVTAALTYRWLGASLESVRYSLAVALGSGSVVFFVGFGLGLVSLGRVFGVLLGLGLAAPVGGLVALALHRGS
ncbi:hypothetical protein [Halospeciosus flavus]|uniref:TIGR04206 family protein n=1 Tax=Halospeciosus flavus TaxID=3032283 RepID=A0ABD5Z9F0_9EURY|nr:hypothetical protein [Halospeciosus flavus]